MRNSREYVQVLIFLAVLIVGHGAEIKDKRQVNTEVATEEEDRIPSETGFAESVHAGSKYYQDIYMAQLVPDEIEFGHVREDDDEWEQRFEKINLNDRSRQGKVLIYAHVPAKDHYEFGEKRGNDHHFIERHEKAHPHAGEFKTKVRWGDKHGGYGEHYWDYNHAGHDHHDGDGEESQKEEEYANYAESEQVPAITKSRQRRDLLNGDVEFIDGRTLSLVERGDAAKHGGNYKRDPSIGRKAKRQDFYEPTFGIRAESVNEPRETEQGAVKFFTDFN